MTRTAAARLQVQGCGAKAAPPPNNGMRLHSTRAWGLRAHRRAARAPCGRMSPGLGLASVPPCPLRRKGCHPHRVATAGPTSAPDTPSTRPRVSDGSLERGFVRNGLGGKLPSTHRPLGLMDKASDF